MRFAQRYADANGMGYSQNQDSDQTDAADDQQA
jgi:photosystem II protein